jgi:hypothetical protein
VLEFGLAVLSLAALYWACFRFSRLVAGPQTTAEGKPMGYVSPTDKAFIRVLIG